ncbi:MAG: hypothetical protein ACKO83_04860 [Roseiflexaceae bacterium]
MWPRYTPRHTSFIGMHVHADLRIIMITHTSNSDACAIVQEILQDYEINHPVHTRIDRLWDALDSWCDEQQATHQRIRGALPATDQSLLPVMVPTTHRVEIWAIAARGQQPPRQPLDVLPMAQFVRGPLAPMQQRWMQLKKRHDDDEGHMHHHFFHE